jgi:hypothetical protein
MLDERRTNLTRPRTRTVNQLHLAGADAFTVTSGQQHRIRTTGPARRAAGLTATDRAGAMIGWGRMGSEAHVRRGAL